MAQTKAQVDKLLTNVSNGYFPKGYIADLVLPELSVKQKSGIIGSYGNDHIRIVDDLIGGRAEAKRVEPVSRSKDNTYLIQSHALEDIVTEADYNNVEEPFNAESDAVQGLTHLILTNKEKALADNLFSGSVITQTSALSGANKWSDSTSNPLAHFTLAQNTVLDGCGMMPNAAIISQKTFNTLKYHPAILENLGFSQARAGQLSIQEIAKAMGVDELLVGSVAYNAAKKGQADSFQQLWGTGALFYVKPSGPAKMQVSLGYKMKLTSGDREQVYRYPVNNPPNANAFIVKSDYSFELANTKAAYLFTAVL